MARGTLSTTSHHLNENDVKIIVRQSLVKRLLGGDVNVSLDLYREYADIATRSARYIYWSTGTNTPFEDVEQQAHLGLLHTLRHRVCGKDKPGLAEINQFEDYDPCLGIKGYLITSVRGFIKTYLRTNSNIIRIPKYKFEKENCDEQGEPIGLPSFADFEADIFRSAKAQPHQLAIAQELLLTLQLTDTEQTILQCRYEGKTMDEIADLTQVARTSVYRKLQEIQNRYKSWRLKNG
jgi:RNA polymerase sigma factor (sigma-70 family)